MSEAVDSYLKARAERREPVKAAEKITGDFCKAARQLQNWRTVSFVQTRSPGRNALSGASGDPIVTSDVPSIHDIQTAVTIAKGAIDKARDLWEKLSADQRKGLKGPDVAD